MNRRQILAAGASVAALLASFRLTGRSAAEDFAGKDFAGKGFAGESFAVVKTDAEWKRQLGSAEYAILRGHGTERAGSSPLNAEKRSGRFACAGCDLPLFTSETKFESGTGWPSFWAPLDRAVGTTTDRSYGMSRTEVHCSRCGGHLGHVFNDGPKPTGQRYCMNGAALRFVPA